MEEINCYRCVHFYITWDETFPRGCRAMDFKSMEMPSVVVRRNSGMECQMFREKRKNTAKRRKK